MVGKKGGCNLNEEQKTFLKACLEEPDQALIAWKQWSSEHVLEKLDPALFRLLPLLYYRLKDFLDESDRQILKGIYRRTCYENQLLFHFIGTMLKELHAHHIPTLLLKGIALAHSYYPTPYTRSMGDADVLIPSKDVDRAIELFLSKGWMIKTVMTGQRYPLKTEYKSTMHACTLSKNGIDFDLHWHLFREVNHAPSDLFWKRAVPMHWHKEPTLTLSPTDHLLHTCIHGYQWNALHPIRWVVDAHMIMKMSGDQIEWNFLIDLANQYRLSFRLLKSFEVLREIIPAWVVDSLRTIPKTAFEQYEQQVFTRENEQVEDCKKDVLWHFKRIWCIHRRYYPQTSRMMQCLTYPKTLSNELYLQHTAELPAKLIHIAWKKCRCYLQIFGGRDL